jgi:hypothetical protein
MGKLSKLKPQLPFNGRKAKISSDGEGSHSEKEKYVGPYDNSPIPRLTIHSFIMGMFLLEYLTNRGTYEALNRLILTLRSSRCICVHGGFHFWV